jgi:hypothetical protein
MKEYYCGPTYFPKKLRKILSFPLNKACRLHDRFYSKKTYPRIKADFIFFFYSIKISLLRTIRGLLGLVLAPIYLLAVIPFGILSWRNYNGK